MVSSLTNQRQGLRDPVATVAICTRDRVGQLRLTLEGLARQRCSFGWEILVVDNGSTDGSGEAVLEFARATHVCVRMCREPRRGVSHARNRALEEARGAVLVFVDDDMDCDPDLLETHVRAFDDPTVAATGGRIIPLLPRFDTSAPRWLREALHNDIGGPSGRYDFGDAVLEVTRASGIALPFTGNMGLRREVALEAGGFRTDLGWSPDGSRIGGEDTDLMKRLRDGYGRVLYLPAAVVRHRVAPHHVTERYYRDWHLSCGKASVLMRPRRGPLGTLLKLIEQVFRVVRYSLPPISFFYPKSVRLRKRYQAIGRILQLLADMTRGRAGDPLLQAARTEQSHPAGGPSKGSSST